VIMNSQEPYARVRRINELSDWYFRNGYEIYVRGLDREALARLAGEGKTVYGLDPEFSDFFHIGGK